MVDLKLCRRHTVATCTTQDILVAQSFQGEHLGGLKVGGSMTTVSDTLFGPLNNSSTQ